MHTAAVTRLELKADLERALDRGELRVRYQPIFALADGALDGFETLVRWRHPDRGEVGPGDFVPLAEETGLIVPIGRWVLVQACRQAQAWRAAGGDRVKISVNLAARQLRDPDVVAMVAAVLAETGLEPDALTLELTESSIMQDDEGRLQELRGLGIHLGLDDFGTGYSSLSYLSRFPIETLKIDRSFTSRLGGPDEETALVESVIQLATSMGMETVGEGSSGPSSSSVSASWAARTARAISWLDRWTPSGPRPWPPPAMSRPCRRSLISPGTIPAWATTTPRSPRKQSGRRPMPVGRSRRPGRPGGRGRRSLLRGSGRAARACRRPTDRGLWPGRLPGSGPYRRGGARRRISRRGAHHEVASSAPLPPGRLRRRPRGGRGTTAEDLTSEQARVLFLWMRDFRRAGHALEPAAQGQLEQIRARLVELEIAFNRTINEFVDGIDVTRDELDGLPDDFIDRLSPGSRAGTLRVSLDYPEVYPFLAQATNRHGARSCSASTGRGRWTPTARSGRGLRLRQEAATLLGQPTWAHHAIEVKMAETPEAVAAFYDSLVPRLEAVRDRELAVLTDRFHADGHTAARGLGLGLLRRAAAPIRVRRGCQSRRGVPAHGGMPGGPVRAHRGRVRSRVPARRGSEGVASVRGDVRDRRPRIGRADRVVLCRLVPAGGQVRARGRLPAGRGSSPPRRGLRAAGERDPRQLHAAERRPARPHPAQRARRPCSTNSATSSTCR